MKAAMTHPVLPLPPLQCTTATCWGSESSHDLMDLHTLQKVCGAWVRVEGGGGGGGGGGSYV